MFCIRCGKEIGNGSKFCLYCGATQLEDPTMSMYQPRQEDLTMRIYQPQQGQIHVQPAPVQTPVQPAPVQMNVQPAYAAAAPAAANNPAPIKKRSSAPVIAAICGALFIIALIVIAIVVPSLAGDKKEISRHMKLAERYLDDLDYDRAIAEYKAVLEIDPKNEEAIRALSDAYIEWAADTDDQDEADEIIQEAFDYLARMEKKQKDDDDIPELFFIYEPGGDYNAVYGYVDGEVRMIAEAPELWYVDEIGILVATDWQDMTENSVTRLFETLPFGGADESGRNGVDAVYNWDGRELETLAEGWDADNLSIGGSPVSIAEYRDYTESFDAVRLCNTPDELLVSPSEMISRLSY